MLRRLCLFAEFGERWSPSMCSTVAALLCIEFFSLVPAHDLFWRHTSDSLIFVVFVEVQADPKEVIYEGTFCFYKVSRAGLKQFASCSCPSTFHWAVLLGVGLGLIEGVLQTKRS